MMRARPPRLAWLARFSNVVGLTATENPTGKVLPSSSGLAGAVGPPFDPGDATGLGLLGAELAREAREDRRVAELAPAFHRKPDPVGLPDLDRGPRDRDGLARDGSLDIEHGDLGLVDGYSEPVTILGAAGPAVERRQGGQSRSPSLDRYPALADAMGDQPVDGPLELGGIRPDRARKPA